MATYDMRVIWDFLLAQNNDKALNIKKLCIVGCDAPTRATMRITKARDGSPQFDLGDSNVRNDWRDANVKRRVQTGDHTVPYLGARTKFIPVEQVVVLDMVPGVQAHLVPGRPRGPHLRRGAGVDQRRR